jgi:hypothetical protein
MYTVQHCKPTYSYSQHIIEEKKQTGYQVKYLIDAACQKHKVFIITFKHYSYISIAINLH